MAISLREKRRYRLSGKPWAGDWKYVPTKEDCNDRPNYEIQALFIGPPVPVTSEGLVKAVRFYEQVKRENPPVETGAWKDAVDWVLREACCAAILGKADNPPASGNQVSELTMWVKRLVSQLKKLSRTANYRRRRWIT